MENEKKWKFLKKIYGEFFAKNLGLFQLFEEREKFFSIFSCNFNNIFKRNFFYICDKFSTNKNIFRFITLSLFWP